MHTTTPSQMRFVEKSLLCAYGEAAHEYTALSIQAEPSMLLKCQLQAGARIHPTLHQACICTREEQRGAKAIAPSILPWPAHLSSFFLALRRASLLLYMYGGSISRSVVEPVLLHTASPASPDML
jgi:hypothetical protein